MRLLTLLSLIALICFCAGATACNGMSTTPPDITARFPLLLDAVPNTVAGPRLVETRQYVTPSYAPPAAPAGACYAPSASSPCDSGVQYVPPALPTLPPGYTYSR